jgi:uncharacterized membrane protein (DUF2068 family)
MESGRNNARPKCVNNRSSSRDATRSIQFIALLEATKGALVLLAGFGVFGLIHGGAQLKIEELVRHFHLNPASRFPQIFVKLADNANDSTFWLLACAAFMYSVLRFVEAFGLWCERCWAKWFGIVTGAVYIPIEVYELFHSITWPKVTLLSVNTICVICLARTLRSHNQSPRSDAAE